MPLFPSNAKSALSLRTYNLAELGISTRQFASRAVRICKKLQAAGYPAYIVGGGMRDLLAGLPPKDFDVATSARPQQIRKVFPRARLIGKRFPIVHEGPPQDPIEVTTFRRPPSPADRIKSALSRGKVADENYSDSLEDDLHRRDFTINALYFDPVSRQVLDYTGGCEDMQARRLRCIGDPMQRMREDPIRIYRALRFAAKCDLQMEEGLEQALRQGAVKWTPQVNPHRRAMELEKFFLQGHAQRSLEILLDYGLLDEILFEGCAELAEWEEPMGVPGLVPARLIAGAMHSCDRRYHQNQGNSLNLLVAVFLWPWVAELALRQSRGPEFPERVEQMVDLTRDIPLPKWRQAQVAALLHLQRPLSKVQDELTPRLLQRGRNLRPSLELLRLRQKAGEPLQADVDSLLRQCPREEPEERRNGGGNGGGRNRGQGGGGRAGGDRDRRPRRRRGRGRPAPE